MAKYTRILSIDGGGIRGVIPGQILVELEEKLGGRLSDYFDLIAGTSTGGILACLYLAPDKNGNAKFSAQEAVDLYGERGDEIFDVPLWHKITSVGGLNDEKYPADELEEALEDYLGNLKLSQMRKACLVTAYNIKKSEPMFFTKPSGIEDSPKFKKKNYRVRDVARATSAAPTFFEVARIKSDARIPVPLIDGGVFANNPTLCAYAEARGKLPGSPTAKDMVILSLGTGKIKKSYSYNEAKDWGLASWVKPLIGIMMSGVSDTVDFQVKQIFDSVDLSDQYFRINPDIDGASPEMDNASESNIRALKNVGTNAAKENDAILNKIVGLLKA